MKLVKKMACIVLALAAALALAVPAFAAGETGTITITNAAAGQTYAAYKIFDATYNETTKTTAYTVDTTSPVYTEIDTKLFTLSDGPNANTKYVVRKDGVTDEEILDWVKNTVTGLGLSAADTQTADNSNTVTFEVPYGYYYITSSLGTTITVDKNTPNVNVIDKNTTNPGPAPTDPDGQYKFIVNGDTTPDSASASASVGATVNYKVIFEATNFVTETDADATTTTAQIKEYTVTDVPDGVQIDPDTYVVKVGDQTLTEETGYTVSEDGLTITIPWAENTADEGEDPVWASLYSSPVTVEITYSAEVITAGTATNNVQIGYTTVSGDSEDITPDPDEPQTEIYNYAFDLVKTDSAGTVLTGAQFELYDALTGGNKINLVEEDGAYRVATTAEAAADGFTSAVINAGNVTIKGLGDGTYYLEETAAPDGYNKLTVRTRVEIDGADLTANVTEGTDGAADQYKCGGVQVENQSGAELPSTGGIGTTIFYTGGGILVLAAVILLVTKKRMSSAD